MTSRLLLRRRRVAGEQGLPLLSAAGGGLRTGVVDREHDRHPVGEHPERRRLQRQPQLERQAGRVVRDRIARGQVRHQLPARELVHHDRGEQQRAELYAAERAAALGDGVGDADLALRRRQGERRAVRAGPVDGETRDAQCGRALRLLQRLRARPAPRPGPAGADAQCRFCPRSTTSRTGRTSRRAWASRSTCSATARPPSRPASAATCRPTT